MKSQLFFLSQSPKLPLAGIWKSPKKKRLHVSTEFLTGTLFPLELQTVAIQEILCFKQKQTFLSLLTESDRSYFNEDFFLLYSNPLPFITSAQNYAAQAV